MKILVIGGASYDEIIHVDEFFDQNPKTIFAKSSYSTAGSTGVGKALSLCKLDFDVTFQAIIGRDHEGDLIRNQLIAEKIKFYPYFCNITEKHTNIMNRDGQRISIFTHYNDQQLVDVSEFENLIENTDIVVLNIKDYCRKFIPLIKKHNKPIYCDIHDYDLGNPYHEDFIEAADYLFLSSEKLSDYQSFMKKMIEQGKQWVVVTHGANGSSVMDRDGLLMEIPGEKLAIVDTNGAGDNFFSGFLFGYLNEYSMKDSLYLGRIAARTCIESTKISSDLLDSDYLLKKMFETDKN